MRGYSEFVLFILDQLEPLAVIAKKMFGGYGLYAGDIFFGIIDKETLFFKTNTETAEKYKKEGMKPFAPSPEQVLKNYYEVPPALLEERETLEEWAREAISISEKK